MLEPTTTDVRLRPRLSFTRPVGNGRQLSIGINPDTFASANVLEAGKGAGAG